MIEYLKKPVASIILKGRKLNIFPPWSEPRQKCLLSLYYSYFTICHIAEIWKSKLQIWKGKTNSSEFHFCLCENPKGLKNINNSKNSFSVHHIKGVHDINMPYCDDYLDHLVEVDVFKYVRFFHYKFTAFLIYCKVGKYLEKNTLILYKSFSSPKHSSINFNIH